MLCKCRLQVDKCDHYFFSISGINLVKKILRIDCLWRKKKLTVTSSIFPFVQATNHQLHAFTCDKFSLIFFLKKNGAQAGEEVFQIFL